MSGAYAPWLDDPDDPADHNTTDDPAGSASNVAAMYPELIDKSSDGPIAALKAAAQDVVSDDGTDPHVKSIVRVFLEAISILDQSEPGVRDMVENGLMDVAGINRTKVSDAMLTKDQLVKQIAEHRKKHIKAAFRHLRDNLPSDI